MAGALVLTRLIKGLLFQVSATDPPIFAGISLLFLAVAFAAIYVIGEPPDRFEALILGVVRTAAVACIGGRDDVSILDGLHRCPVTSSKGQFHHRSACSNSGCCAGLACLHSRSPGLAFADSRAWPNEPSRS